MAHWLVMTETFIYKLSSILIIAFYNKINIEVRLDNCKTCMKLSYQNPHSSHSILRLYPQM